MTPTPHQTCSRRISGISPLLGVFDSGVVEFDGFNRTPLASLVSPHGPAPQSGIGRLCQKNIKQNGQNDRSKYKYVHKKHQNTV